MNKKEVRKGLNWHENRDICVCVGGGGGGRGGYESKLTMFITLKHLKGVGGGGGSIPLT